MNSSYSSSFKQNIVELAFESERPVVQTARNLGVNANIPYTWITKYHQAVSPINKGSDEKYPCEELKQLRKENTRLKKEPDIPKKGSTGKRFQRYISG